jgi:tetratricopeptide (TPR) repeat protein
MAHIFRGDNARAEASISAAHELFHELDDRRGEAWALQNLAWISYIDGRPDEAETRLDESAALFDALDDRGGLAWAQGLMGFVRYHQGRFDDAEHLATAVLGDARERGDKWGEGMMLLLTASVRLWSGRAAAAVDPADEAVALFRSINDVFGQAQGEGVLGRALVMSGRVDDGLRVLRHAREQYTGDDALHEQADAVAAMLLLTATQLGDVVEGGDALIGLAEADASGLGAVELVVGRALVALQRGDADPADHALQAVVQGEGANSSFAVGALALAAATVGRRSDVPELAARVEELPRATYLDRATVGLARELSRVAAGDEDAIDGFVGLVAMVDETEDQCAQAVVRLAEAMALDALGHPTAEWALAETERRLDELDIRAAGWRTAFAQVLAPDKATAST